ncbi:MAG TPA: transposase [Planctomycetota bacterium]|nr:transposase [Planctomycetota bacterium]
MARLARTVLPDVPHHVTQRGNFRQTVFESDSDRKLYLAWLAEYSARYGLEHWAYCLMPNHVHFIAVPRKPDSLARTFNQTHMRFSQHVNRRKRRTGHLWQGRFFSCALDEAHVYRAVRYVEMNPVRTRMVNVAWEYRWSSAKAHVLGEHDEILNDGTWFRKSMSDWRAYLEEAEGQAWLAQLRGASRTGVPIGSQEFVKRIESSLGRAVLPKARGRPRKCEGNK